jgi:DNA-binding GntR family transcriptional regulator
VPIREQSHEEHTSLIDACRKRDAKLGAKLLEQHVKTAGQQIISVVETIMARQG